MRTKESIKAKRTIAITAVLVGIGLSIMMMVFVNTVRNQLWQQSVNTILESTRQGLNTLQIQLQNEYDAMESVSAHIKNFNKNEQSRIESFLSEYGSVDQNVSLYLNDGRFYPASLSPDKSISAILEKSDAEKGIVDPHISSVTGLNVFNLYVPVSLRDGTAGFLVKEYEVAQIVDSFSVSFYNDAGFSYVVDIDGNVLIRPPHPNSNKTVQNLYDILQESPNAPVLLEQFSEALNSSKTGWATLSYQGEDTVFCYLPLRLQSDWYLISIIPASVVNEQTNQIIVGTFVLIAGIILGIVLLVVLYFCHVNRTNRKLRNQAEYISRLYNAVPEGIALMTVEEPYHFLQLNEEGQRLLGYSEDSTNDTFAGLNLQNTVHPEDYKGIVSLFQDAEVNGTKNIFAIRIKKKDGTYFWASGIVEKTLDENGIPVFITAIHDITKEKVAEEEETRRNLQERLTLVSAISNAYPVIITLNLTQDKLKFVYIKSNLMLPLGQQNSYSELYESMLPTINADSQEEYMRCFAPKNLIHTLVHERNEVSFETKQLLTDGIYHWISTQIIAVDNPYSKDKLAILISRRIDEKRYEEERKNQALKSALESAQAANLAKSKFLSNMSHDIRTPLNAILGMTAIASAHPNDSDRVMECLKKINISGKHLLSLINDVLDMSRIENKKVSLREETFYFSELVSDTVDLVRAQTDAGKLQLDVHLSALKNDEVIGDPLRIRQIYINILSNAVKYTPEGGRICVEVSQEEKPHKEYVSYILKCSDTGIGMSQEFLERLFQPFERGAETVSSKMTGTGLGMAITKNLVDMMNGGIQVESEVGKGSVVTVTIPLKRRVGKGDVQHESGYETATSSWNSLIDSCDFAAKHILLAEDNEINLEIARTLLEETGAHVTDVPNGAEAVRVITESAEGYYDLIFMDIQMPVMDGYEAAKAIRNLERKDASAIPIVAMTANAFDEDVREALKSGMDAHLSKPIDIVTLKKTLHRFLSDDGWKRG